MSARVGQLGGPLQHYLLDPPLLQFHDHTHVLPCPPNSESTQSLLYISCVLLSVSISGWTYKQNGTSFIIFMSCTNVMTTSLPHLSKQLYTILLIQLVAISTLCQLTHIRMCSSVYTCANTSRYHYDWR